MKQWRHRECNMELRMPHGYPAELGLIPRLEEKNRSINKKYIFFVDF